MLVLSRKVGEQIIIGDIVLTVTDLSAKRVSLGIDAPASVKILRDELIDSAPCTICGRTGTEKNGSECRESCNP